VRELKPILPPFEHPTLKIPTSKAWVAFLKYNPLVIILVVSSNVSSGVICKIEQLTLDDGPKLCVIIFTPSLFSTTAL
jgi:hypothetical protein